MVNLVLAEDHPFIRKTIRTLLNREPEFNVVREINNGLDAVSLVRELQPDVLVTDLVMPRLSGLEAARRILLSQPETRIIMVTIKYSLPYIREAIKTGILGYLHKDVASDHLIKAVHAVLQGQRYVYPPVSEEDLKDSPVNELEATLNAWEMLTRQEKEMLKFVAEESRQSNGQGDTPLLDTGIQSHHQSLMNRLGFQTYPELIAFLNGRK